MTIWLANYLAGVCQKKTVILEMNNHGDFQRIGRFCGGLTSKKNFYQILDVDYYSQANAKNFAECLNGDYHHILVDYGEITEQNLYDCTRCNRKIIVGSLSEWQAEAFLEFAASEKKRDTSWNYAAAFGSEQTRKQIEKCFHIRIWRIPGSVDAFTINRDDINFFSEFFRN